MRFDDISYFMSLKLITDQIQTYGSKEIILNNSKRRYYKIKCHHCSELVYKAQCEILRGLKRNKMFFCSRKCENKSRITKINVNCANCTKVFLKHLNQISKTKNNFCSKSCAAKYNNTHKIKGTRRSKLEKAIEEMLKLEYPELSFNCNNKKIIGSELDFYFPSLNLAIQINGPLHYNAIYGTNKLSQIQKMDEEKRNICDSKNITLIEINVSKDTHPNKVLDKRLSEIKIILAEARVLETQAS